MIVIPVYIYLLVVILKKLIFFLIFNKKALYNL